MKKIFIPVIAVMCLFGFTTKVEAKAFTYNSFNKLNIMSAMVVGDYIFNLDNGYSPTLRDIMIASRSIDEDKPTELYQILNMPSFGFFRQQEIYSNTVTTDTNQFKVFDAKYIFYNSIAGAKEGDYEVLS